MGRHGAGGFEDTHSDTLAYATSGCHLAEIHTGSDAGRHFEEIRTSPGRRSPTTDGQVHANRSGSSDQRAPGGEDPADSQARAWDLQGDNQPAGLRNCHAYDHRESGKRRFVEFGPRCNAQGSAPGPCADSASAPAPASRLRWSWEIRAALIHHIGSLVRPKCMTHPLIQATSAKKIMPTVMAPQPNALVHRRVSILPRQG